jgi:exonuclease III
VRVVTWNLGYWTPGKFNSIANRQRQWRFLLRLAPDLMLLQECRPEDLATVDGAAPYEVVGAIPKRWTACSAVVAKRDLDPLAAERPGPWFEFLSGYVALSTIATEIGRLLVASVHTPARVVEDPCLTDADHATLRRPGVGHAWHNDLAFAAIAALQKEAGFIVGGDWNTARLFDTVHPEGTADGAMAGGEFFTRAASHGWVETMRQKWPDEVQTYLKTGVAAYELDHVFTDAALAKQFEDCKVVLDIDGTPAANVSDHAPVVTDFSVGAKTGI